jgi:hypothetical protein
LELSENRGMKGWTGNAVFALDRLIRSRLGIYEYSAHERCIFRINRDRADDSLSLKDGTQIRRGDPILKLHLWNEHMPCMRQGPSVAWGREVTRAMEISLQELASYLERDDSLREVRAICADMCLGTPDRRSQLARIVGRFGFEGTAYGLGQPGPLEFLSSKIMMFLLVLVTNPSTLRGTILLRAHQRIYLSREALVARYAGRARTGGQPHPGSGKGVQWSTVNALAPSAGAAAPGR